MKTIYKRIWPDMFDNDQKLPVDFRLADFDLNDGDEICFQEWDPVTKKYTGRQYTKIVKRVTKHESPTRYWTKDELDQHGLYLVEWEEKP